MNGKKRLNFHQGQWIGRKFRLQGRILLSVMFLVLLSSCGLSNSNKAPAIVMEPPAMDKAQIIFTVTLPEQLSADETLELVIIDEVTGVPFNQTRLPMTLSENKSYAVFYSAPVGTVINYRYEKISNGSRFTEHNYLRVPVEKRIFIVNGPAKVFDFVAGFDEKLVQPPVPGYVTGRVVHAETGMPLADIMIFCEGLQTVTDGDGRFTLYPLYPAPTGQHDIFALSPNGAYLPFHQGIAINYKLSTPVEISMTPVVWKKVVFTVTVPEDTIDGAIIRIAGNLTQLGNTFQDLGGGIYGDVHNMPVMVKNEVGKFELTMNLPVGIDIRYKYTLGDGFWNSEHGLDQSFVVHQLIIPADVDDVYVHDKVSTWRSSQTETIWFQVRTPENTPPDENIGIQFKLADWMPPLPMYKIEEGRWAYPILSPHNFSGTISYRYCRNGPCTGSYQPGVEVLASPRGSTTRFEEVKLITDEITGWVSLETDVEPIMDKVQAQGREEGFLAGISYTPYYSLTSQPFMETSIESISKYANLAVFSPAWAAQDPNLPALFVPNKTETPSWYETVEELEHANDYDLFTGIFPQIVFEGGSHAWWQAANTADEAWWENWIGQYRSFIYQYADLAQRTEADVLVIGGDWVLNAMPIGSNFEQYSQPGNIEQIWLDTIEQIRSRFGGMIALQIPIEYLENFPLSILSSVDQLYVQWDLPIEAAESGIPLAQQIGDSLDTIVQPIISSLKMDAVVVLAYPSAQGFTSDCIPSRVEPDTCLDAVPLLFGPAKDIRAVTDLDIQTKFYMAALQAIDARPWIHGIISQGYYPAIEMHDASASIHGKPAEELLMQWYPQFLGN